MYAFAHPRHIDLTENPRIRVLLVDPQTLFCEGLSRLAGEVEPTLSIRWATALPAALKEAARFPPHVVLLSPRICGTAWENAAKEIRKTNWMVRLILLDDDFREFHIQRAITMDAMGYWTKGNSFAELTGAIRLIAEGGRSFCPRAAPYVIEAEGRLQFRFTCHGKGLGAISPRELDVMRCIAQGMSLKECAQHLGVATNTVANHKCHLMEKLGLHKATDLTRLAVSHGLV
jgi:DNA-binding NarL/FixJ family response regulator